MTDIIESPPGLFKRIAVIVYDALLLIAVLFLATLVLYHSKKTTPSSLTPGYIQFIY